MDALRFCFFTAAFAVALQTFLAAMEESREERRLFALGAGTVALVALEGLEVMETLLLLWLLLEAMVDALLLLLLLLVAEVTEPLL